MSAVLLADDFEVPEGGGGLIASLFADCDDDELSRLLSVARDGDAEAGVPLLRVDRDVAAFSEDGSGRIRPDDSIADDFDDSQWALVLQLRAICQDAIREKVSPPKRQRAIEWLFIPNKEFGMSRGRAPGPASTFSLVCAALGARDWVIRALIHHLWYLRDMRIGMLPMLAAPLPEALENEALLKGWEAGGRLAGIAWSFPGIEKAIAIESVVNAGVSHQDTLNGLDAMLDSGLLGIRGTRLYFSARNSQVRKSGSIGWARSFL